MLNFKWNLIILFINIISSNCRKCDKNKICNKYKDCLRFFPNSTCHVSKLNCKAVIFDSEKQHILCNQESVKRNITKMDYHYHVELVCPDYMSVFIDEGFYKGRKTKNITNQIRQMCYLKDYCNYEYEKCKLINSTNECFHSSLEIKYHCKMAHVEKIICKKQCHNNGICEHCIPARIPKESKCKLCRCTKNFQIRLNQTISNRFCKKDNVSRGMSVQEILIGLLIIMVLVFIIISVGNMVYKWYFTRKRNTRSNYSNLGLNAHELT